MPKRLHHALNPRTVASLNKPGTYADGAGLALKIDGRLNKRWVWRGTVDGKAAMRGLGSYPTVSLAEARKAASAVAETAKAPDPERPPVPTFRRASREYISENSPAWRNPKHAAQWRNTLSTYADPVIGDKRMDEITTGDVLAVLKPIWSTKTETASRVRQRMEKIFDWAIVHDHREKANPATKAIMVGLPKVKRTKEHHRALPYADVPAALHKVSLSTAYPLTKLGFQFLVLTAARSGEVRMADWSEINLDSRMWTIPADRMKAGREHRVPLSTEALALLRDARALGSGEGLIFPAKEGGAMSDMVFTAMLRRLKVDSVPHGFRSSFRDWCVENGVTRELAESALSHSIGSNTVESAYLRSDMAEQRRGLMKDWADFCCG